MFAYCHFGSCIDAAFANYESGRHIAYAMGKRAGQAPVLKRPAAKMCSPPRTSQPGTLPGYASDSVHTASTAANFDAQRLASGGNALGTAVAELSALSCSQLRARATSLGVSHRDESKRQKRRNQLEEDCRRALGFVLLQMDVVLLPAGCRHPGGRPCTSTPWRSWLLALQGE